MKKFILLFAIVSIALVSCDVEQKKEMKLPDVDVDVDTEAGQLPTFDVDWADVDLKTTTKTVKVPKVVVVMEEVEVEVPYIDVDMPDAGEKEERNLVVEAEVIETEHDLKIQKVYANNKNLVVVATLEELSQTLGDKKLRVSDQLTLNAPEDLNVKYYIVGEKPNRIFNSAHKYFSSMNDVEQKLKDYSVIYSK
ncbi:hypothetical protein P8625_15100 [Tenacibaculum tangerinum]|uniref:SPOR domain-containing protein n=1 Tax=Tenacibaculum tangerinum TaxID=3038772 RepID=A0ABY8L292_9FLAO|nr:hypothetical protein [Tenacibaculum tangerinum]WGH75379.1 hypothetical protein P8625_15100 [Tenacibaculum tangerinum]